MMAEIFNIFLIVCLAVLSIAAVFAFVRVIKGPTVADRIVANNMLGSLAIAILGILTFYLHEGWLADVCLIYAMISFLAVVVLVKVYLGVHRQRQMDEAQDRKE